jgi:mono/diheme cytochrome c family protein
MKTHLPLLILALLVISLFTLGCGPQPMSPPTPIPTLVPATLPAVTPTPIVKVEIEPTSPPSEPASPEELAQAGQEVFENSCAVCHNLSSETLVGPGLEQLFNRDQLPNGEPFSEEGLKAWIVTGGGAMPGLPLTEEQLEAVVAFLKEATQP